MFDPDTAEARPADNDEVAHDRQLPATAQPRSGPTMSGHYRTGDGDTIGTLRPGAMDHLNHKSRGHV